MDNINLVAAKLYMFKLPTKARVELAATVEVESVILTQSIVIVGNELGQMGWRFCSFGEHCYFLFLKNLITRRSA